MGASRSRKRGVKLCLVELDPATRRPIRIFRNKRTATASEAWARGDVRWIDAATAKLDIRIQVFERAGRECERCGKPLTWDSLHMHERIHRGKGGEVSTENGEALCYECHIGPLGEHSGRSPRFTKAAGDEST